MSTVQIKPRFLTIPQFSQITGLSRPTIYRRIKSGVLPSSTDLGRHLIPVSVLDKMESHALSPKV